MEKIIKVYTGIDHYGMSKKLLNVCMNNNLLVEYIDHGLYRVCGPKETLTWLVISMGLVLDWVKIDDKYTRAWRPAK